MMKLRMIIRRLSAPVVLSAFVSVGAYAQTSRALEVLQTNPDVRTSALGDALGVRQDRMSLFVSPLALIPGDGNFGLELSSQIFPKVEGLDGRSNQYNVIAGYKFLERHALSIGFRYQSAPYIEYSYIDRPVPVDGGNPALIKPFEWVLDLAYGFQITKDFSMSVSGNFVTSWIGKAGYTGGASVGAFYNHDFGSYGILGVALKANDLGAPVYYKGGGGYAMPASGQLSAEWGKTFAEKHSIDLLLGGRYFFLPLSAQSVTVGGGVEYGYDDLVYVRLGGNYGTRSLSKITAGAGCKIVHRFSIDIAYSHGLDNRIGIDIWSVGATARF